MSKSERQRMKQLNVNSDGASSDDLNGKLPNEPLFLPYQKVNDVENSIKVSKLNISKGIETNGKVNSIDKTMENTLQDMKRLNINGDRSSPNDLKKKSPSELGSGCRENNSQVDIDSDKFKKFETINENVEEGKLYLINKLLESERQRIK